MPSRPQSTNTHATDSNKMKIHLFTFFLVSSITQESFWSYLSCITCERVLKNEQSGDRQERSRCGMVFWWWIHFYICDMMGQSLEYVDLNRLRLYICVSVPWVRSANANELGWNFGSSGSQTCKRIHNDFSQPSHLETSLHVNEKQVTYIHTNIHKHLPKRRAHIDFGQKYSFEHGRRKANAGLKLTNGSDLNVNQGSHTDDTLSTEKRKIGIGWGW